jgi:hypothetical protein
LRGVVSKLETSGLLLLTYPFNEGGTPEHSPLLVPGTTSGNANSRRVLARTPPLVVASARLTSAAMLLFKVGMVIRLQTVKYSLIKGVKGVMILVLVRSAI